MTGRDLIIYILQNNLEDKPVFENGRLLDFMNIQEAALKFGVGTATVEFWYRANMIKGITVGENIYILPDSVPVTLYEQK
jgi:hypothetical protein